MPTYEYACESCAHQFEQFQPITARALRRCPVCGAPRLRRLIGAGGGVIFKGSGFYQTDYRSESYKQAAAAEQAAAGGKGAKGAGADQGKQAGKSAAGSDS